MSDYKCPKCKSLTVVDSNHCYVRCLSCGWYTKATALNDMTIQQTTIKDQQGNSPKGTR